MFIDHTKVGIQIKKRKIKFTYHNPKSKPPILITTEIQIPTNFSQLPKEKQQSYIQSSFKAFFETVQNFLSPTPKTPQPSKRK